MNMNIKDFALKTGIELEDFVQIIKLLGIKKTILNDEEQGKIIQELKKKERRNG